MKIISQPRRKWAELQAQQLFTVVYIFRKNSLDVDSSSAAAERVTLTEPLDWWSGDSDTAGNNQEMRFRCFRTVEESEQTHTNSSRLEQRRSGGFLKAVR